VLAKVPRVLSVTATDKTRSSPLQKAIVHVAWATANNTKPSAGPLLCVYTPDTDLPVVDCCFGLGQNSHCVKATARLPSRIDQNKLQLHGPVNRG